MLCTLAKQEQGYLSIKHSDELIRTRNSWLPKLTKTAFEHLGRRLANESRDKGTGARSIVRKNGWMTEALENATAETANRIAMEKEMGLTGEGTLSGTLPF